ncbi:hypothetical protein [Modestobacter italicus]|nr:hypothetical protein [Modestobacter italicus]
MPRTRPLRPTTQPRSTSVRRRRGARRLRLQLLMTRLAFPQAT